MAFLYNVVLSLFVLPSILLFSKIVQENAFMVFAISIIFCCVTRSSNNSSLTFLKGSIIILSHVIIEIIIIYELFPIIWDSLVNLILFFNIHIFNILTALWLLLAFDLDIPEKKNLEIFLFTIYPLSMVFLWSWFLSIVTSFRYFFYFYLLTSFITFQVFGKPRQSSYLLEKPLLNWEIHGVILILFILLPSLGFGMQCLWEDLNHALKASNWMEGVFIFTCSCFLSTFLHYRTFALEADIDINKFIYLRRCSAMLMLVLAQPLLQSYGFNPQLFLTFKLKVFLFIVLIYLLNLPRRRFIRELSYLVGLLLLFCLLHQLWSLPWNLRYFSYDPFYINKIFVSILFTTVFSIITIVLYPGLVHGSNSLLKFNYCFVLMQLSFFYGEWNLYMIGTIPRYVLILTSCLIAYLLIMYHKSGLVRLEKFAFCASLVFIIMKVFLVTLHLIEAKKIIYHTSTHFCLLLLLFILVAFNTCLDSTYFHFKSVVKMLLFCYLIISIAALCIFDDLFTGLFALYTGTGASKTPYQLAWLFTLWGILSLKCIRMEEKNYLSMSVAPIWFSMAFLCTLDMFILNTVVLPLFIAGLLMLMAYVRKRVCDNKYKVYYSAPLAFLFALLLILCCAPKLNMTTLFEYFILTIYVASLLACGYALFFLPIKQHEQIFKCTFALACLAITTHFLYDFVLKTEDATYNVSLHTSCVILSIFSILSRLLISMSKKDADIIQLSNHNSFSTICNLVIVFSTTWCVVVLSLLSETEHNWAAMFAPLLLFCIHTNNPMQAGIASQISLTLVLLLLTVRHSALWQHNEAAALGLAPRGTAIVFRAALEVLGGPLLTMVQLESLRTRWLGRDVGETLYLCILLVVPFIIPCVFGTSLYATLYGLLCAVECVRTCRTQMNAHTPQAW